MTSDDAYVNDTIITIQDETKETNGNTNGSQEQPWRERLRSSISINLSTLNVSIKRISDVREQFNAKQCCCCINWYNDYKNRNNNKKNKIMIELPPSYAKKLRNIFKTFDNDNDGELDKNDLALAMKQLGFDMTHSSKKLNQLFIKADLDNNGKINFQEFALAIIKKAPYLFDEANDNELKYVFDIFDCDNDGLINKNDLFQSFYNQGISLTNKQIKQIIDSLANNKTMISFNDFKGMMNSYDDDEKIGLFSCQSPPPPSTLYANYTIDDDPDDTSISNSNTIHSTNDNIDNDDDIKDEETVELMVGVHKT